MSKKASGRPVLSILAVGNATVGNTSIIKAFNGQSFSNNYLLTMAIDLTPVNTEIDIDGVKTKKAQARIKSIDKKKVTTVVTLTIHEGKNHQVKKMFEVLGYKVIKLRRESIGNLNLKGLMPGEYRTLSIKEVKILYSLCKKS